MCVCACVARPANTNTSHVNHSHRRPLRRQCGSEPAIGPRRKLSPARLLSHTRLGHHSCRLWYMSYTCVRVRVRRQRQRPRRQRLTACALKRPGEGVGEGEGDSLKLKCGRAATVMANAININMQTHTHTPIQKEHGTQRESVSYTESERKYAESTAQCQQREPLRIARSLCAALLCRLLG